MSLKHFLLAIAALFIANGCASAQMAIERSFIPAAEAEFPEFTGADSASEAVIDHSAWRDYLNRYARPQDEGPTLVAYAETTDADEASLNAYIAMLEDADPGALNSDEQLAFWINLYNAVTVRLILENYPVDSIRDIKSGPFDFVGPWNEKRTVVAGVPLSLNDIEHKIIRVNFDDARIHYAVNCAAIGCPSLRPTPYDGATIDAAFNEQARAFINDARGVFIDEKGRVTASKIFSWYREDFGESEKDVLRHIAQFAEPMLAAELLQADDIDRHRYDWALNDAR
ncbi:MAG: DUF547 domain-containing protein [Pseudomonadota bacterium]